MRRRIPGLLLAALLLAPPLAADQTDPRLDDLFARLQATDSARQGERIGRRIWALWRATADGEVDAAMERGARALAAGDHAAAERVYAGVVQRAPNYAEGWNKRATARYLRGDLAGSAADIRRTLVLEPRHFGALSGLGLVYMELGRNRAALEALRAALAVNPHLEGVRRNIAIVRARLGAGDA